MLAQGEQFVNNNFERGGEIMSSCNKDIRSHAKDRGVMLWEIADALGINDGNFSRKLRRELSDDEKARIFAIIDRVAAQRASELTATATK